MTGGIWQLFDHPDNKDFPVPWRVDSQMGMGPSRQILGDWKLKKDETAVNRYRIVIYTGSRNDEQLTRLWKVLCVNTKDDFASGAITLQ
jgi:hypothetical protein